MRGEDHPLGRSRLIETGRMIERGRAVETLYAWRPGHLEAAVTPSSVRIRRTPGFPRDALFLDHAEVARLAAACLDWASVRDGWWEFYWTREGIGHSALYYRAAGRVGSAVRLGGVGGSDGVEFSGRDKVVACSPARRVARGVRVVADVRRVGEAVGPPNCQVGLRYWLGPRLRLDVLRWLAEVRRVGAAKPLVLEPGEEEFLEELACVLDIRRARAPKRGTV